MSYEHGENEFCEGYDGPYEHGNGALVYDGDSYEGYDGPWDNEQHGGENYYSGDDFEMNGTYDSCDDVEGMEEPYGVYHCEYEGSYATHHDYDGDVRLKMFEKVTSMVQKRQVIHHEDTHKELPLEEKQDTPCKVGTKELHMEVKTPTPCAPKMEVELEGIF
ncbi:hypothetical protein KY289_020383 [Solanum tuberosum]|nr:hypothetical protein KY289_020383 [Solanum tuberosum]